MGDRSNIVIIQSVLSVKVLTTQGKVPMEPIKVGVGIYSHSCGYRLPEMARQALLHAKSRWGDDSYMTRMFFCNLLKQAGEENFDGEYGWGLYSYTTPEGIGGEESHDTIFIDCTNSTVKIGRKKYSFQQYVDLPPMVEDEDEEV